MEKKNEKVEINYVNQDMPGSFWDSCTDLATLTLPSKRETEHFRVSVSEKEGRKFVCIWRYYMKRNDGIWRNAGKGLNLPMEYLDAAMEVLEKIREDEGEEVE